LPDDEIDLLLLQAELRIKAARHLLNEGFCDDAVSRAYYSMYCEISKEEAAITVEDAEKFLHRAREVINDLRTGT
jgi:uncharacterized protein (UPF0332 family)